MSPSNGENVLTCFYEVRPDTLLAASSFILNDTITQCSSVPIKYQLNNLPGNFKSAVTDDGTKALLEKIHFQNMINILIIVKTLQIK